MTSLVWDEVGARRWETGVDHGVLYLPNGDAVPWNGLTSLNEDLTREVKSYWQDGVKYLDHHVPGSFKATLQAFTYPDEFDEVMGNVEFSPGVFVHDQRTQLFSLSYRTRVGNDLEGSDHGYKIHVIYNLQAAPAAATFATMGASPVPGAFSWELTGTPPQMFGIRPTSHISLDSRRIDPELLTTLEELLYGTMDTEAQLPPLVDLLTMLPGGG